MQGKTQPSNLQNRKVAKNKGFVAPDRLSQQSKDKLVSQFTNNSDIGAYLAMLLNPHDNKAVGLPDSTTARTAVYRSIKTYPIYCDFGSSSSRGRFAVAVQPKLGNLGAPNQYSVAITQGENVDYSTSAAYLAESVGLDPRLDDNVSSLTSSPTAFWRIEVPSQASLGFSLANGVVSTYTRQLEIDVVEGTTPGIKNRLMFPPGAYMVTIYCATSVPGSLSFTAPVGASAAIITLDGNGTSVGNIISTNRIYYSSSSFGIDVGFGFVGNTTLQLSVVPVTPNLGASITENFGNCKKIRPVAMSALFSYSGTSLRNGGMVAACLVPGDSAVDNYFTSQPLLGGNFQLWENLSRVPGAYNGPIREGTYTYWKPDNELDNYLRTPDEANSYAYPTIIISGEYTPGETLSGLVEVGRLEVVQVFEWTTTSTLFETWSRIGSHASMDIVNQAISNYETSMSNPIHLSDIKKFLSDAYNWIKKNKSTLATGASLIGALI